LSRHNFITECFFLTAYGYHVGFIPAANLLKSNTYNHQWNQHIMQFNAIQQALQAGQISLGSLTPQQEAQLKSFEMLYGLRHCREAQVGHPHLLQHALSFADVTCALLRCAAGHPGELVALEGTPPREWRLLPCFLLEDLAAIVEQAARQSSERSVFEYHAHLAELLGTIVLLLESKEYVPQVHIRVALCDALFQASPAGDEEEDGSRAYKSLKVNKVFFHDPLVVRLFIPGLVQLYVDLERNEDDHNNADLTKPRVRRQISKLVGFLVESEDHVEMLRKISKGDSGSEFSKHSETFFKFVLMLASDLTHAFDDAISYLIKIKQELDWQASNTWEELAEPSFLNEMAGRLLENTEAAALVTGHQGPRALDPDSAMTLAVQVLQKARDGEVASQQKVSEARAKVHSRNETMAKWLMQECMQTIRIFVKVAATVPSSLMLPHIADRVAASVDGMLARLVGKQARQIKLPEPQKYSFDPKGLLKDLVTVFVDIYEGSRDNFVAAVARDQRSFSEEVFHRGCSIVEREQLVSTEACATFRAFVKDAVEQSKVFQQEDEILGEVPEDFQDAWTGEIMKDPVTLPSSGMTLDRSSIERHLEGTEAIDPYNRSPLTVDQLVPNVDLRNRIEAFVKEQKAKVGQE